MCLRLHGAFVRGNRECQKMHARQAASGCECGRVCAVQGKGVCVCGLGSMHLRAVSCDSPMQDGGEGGTEAVGRGRGSELERWTLSTAKLP